MHNRVFKSIISVFLTVSMLISFSVFFSSFAASEKGTILNDSVRVRTSPTTTKENQLTISNKDIFLNTGDVVTIIDTVDSEGDNTYKKWYKIKFSYSKKEYTGYVYVGFVKINVASDNVIMPKDVPQIYKTYIEELLKYHPNWNFIFVDTGLDWSSLFSAEAQGFPGRSLLNKQPLSRRSTATGNYNWRTDEWISHDAGGWYQANSETIAYYMDPRNFLNEETIFMFESLSYDENVQNISGVKKIIAGSFMENVKIKNTKDKAVTYAQAYINAGKISGVSPYHLASRTIQEVGREGSGSVSGKYSGYEGLYNFYNINASAGAKPIANGLKYASGVTSSEANKEKYLLPWNTPYKAILGGAKWIANGYIDRNQNTLYYQKFDVVNNNYHQYMQNIGAPASEAKVIRKTYIELDAIDTNFTFIVPYYRNMPKEPCALPEASNANPNNWLSSLKINNYTFGFDAGKTSGYTIEVPTSVSSVKVSATTVNSKAKIKGTGNVSLNEGENTVKVVVTAENGDKRTYKVKIIRSDLERIPLKSITLNKSSLSMFTGDVVSLSLSFNPSTTTDDKTVKWVSSNEKVATVSKGEITAVGEGNATITAKVGECTATCTISVTNNVKKGDIDADNEITIKDALTIFKYKSGEIKLSESAKIAADTTGDGEVKLDDALRIFKFKSGEIEEL